jgi:bacterioferritin-associated ferredoxin
MSNERKSVWKCSCLDIPFKDFVGSHCKTLEDLNEIYGAGTKCGLCTPYLLAYLATKETSFDVINLEDELSYNDP